MKTIEDYVDATLRYFSDNANDKDAILNIMKFYTNYIEEVELLIAAMTGMLMVTDIPESSKELLREEHKRMYARATQLLLLKDKDAAAILKGLEPK